MRNHLNLNLKILSVYTSFKLPFILSLFEYIITFEMEMSAENSILNLSHLTKEVVLV